MVALEYEGNPIKAQGDKALVPRLIRCVVQQQLDHCWMGQTPCDYEFVGSNTVQELALQF